MLGYVIAKGRKRSADPTEHAPVPPDLRRRLRAWLDVDAVGTEGFWIWFRAILPLLPRPDFSDRRGSGASEVAPTEIRAQRQRIATYARDQARLSVICDQYARENRVLTRRLRALESALRTVQLAGYQIRIPPDPDTDEIVARRLPSARPGSARPENSEPSATH